MKPLQKVVRQLSKERNELEHRLEQVDYALRTLSTLTNGHNHLGRPRKFHHTAATKARIAAANRARWARQKKAA